MRTVSRSPFFSKKGLRALEDCLTVPSLFQKALRARVMFISFLSRRSNRVSANVNNWLLCTWVLGLQIPGRILLGVLCSRLPLMVIFPQTESKMTRFGHFSHFLLNTFDGVFPTEWKAKGVRKSGMSFSLDYR